jgi:hypothetical protein
MKWTPKDPVCERCFDADDNNNNCGISNNNNNKSTSKSAVEAAPMRAQIMIGNSWKMRKVEIFHCNACNYEYTFHRYGKILDR